MMMRRTGAIALLTAVMISVLPERVIAQPPPAKPQSAKKPQSATNDPGLDSSFLAPLKWREVGPTSMGGRIVDIAVVEANPSTFWVASASGGLFKTINNGVTFEPQFQKETSISIGDVAVAPSNPNVVWVGTGEHNARNSVSWGNGVYRSTDGGKTWTHLGLKDSFQIGRIAVHPTNPDIAYVGALGRLWGENTERGVFKTTDGGKTWNKVLYLDNKTGCIDITMHPRDPETLIVAMYERKRDPFDGGDPVKRFAPGSGLHRTTDGGRTWKKLTKGLPTNLLGRIGVTYSRSNPLNVFATIETEKIGTAPKGSILPAFMGMSGTGDKNARITNLTPNGPSAKAGLKVNDVITAVDKAKINSYADLIAQIRAHKAGDTVTLTVKRGSKTITLKLTYGSRGSIAGRTNRPFATRLGGQIHNIQAKQGPNGFQTGGIFKSADGGDTWTRINSLNPRPFYYSQIRVDPTDERFIYVMGVSLYQSKDGGKTFDSSVGRSLHPDHHTLWINPRDGRNMILGCDGGLNMTYDRMQKWEFLQNIPIGQFYDVGLDNRTPYRIYGGMQDNGSWGGPSRTRNSVGPTWDQWYAIGGGDGFLCRVDPENPDLVYYESQYGRMASVNIKTGDRTSIRPVAQRNVRYYFNWKTPFQLSHHNPRIFYAAGNYVFKSLNRGSNLRAISPKITRTARGTATAFSESPRDPNVHYVGTDDGWLWGTRDGGRNWTRLKIPGRDGNRRVNSLEASRYVTGRCYAVLDGHYFDSDDPEVWVTEDYGKTWTTLNANLPKQTTRVLREDIANPNLLYLGTEFGIYASVNRGQKWTKLNLNLPNVAVHEIAIHPTAGEIVAGTHGRGMWILDVTALRQLSSRVRKADVALLKPAPAIQWHAIVGQRYYGSKRFIGQNPATGARIFYTLKSKPKQIELTISDIEGQVITKIKPKPSVGLNRVTWSLRRTIRPRNTGRTRPNLSTLSPAARQRFLARFGGRAQPGTYLVTLKVDGKEYKQRLAVQADPDHPTDSLTYEETEKLRKLFKYADD